MKSLEMAFVIAMVKEQNNLQAIYHFEHVFILGGSNDNSMKDKNANKLLSFFPNCQKKEDKMENKELMVIRVGKQSLFIESEGEAFSSKCCVAKISIQNILISIDDKWA